MKKILIVDDEESIRISLCALVSRYGYNVQAAKNGKDALDILIKEDIDVAFVDVRMPEMNGFALLKELSDRQIPTTIIVMSAYGSTDDAREALKSGAFDYITKPFKPNEVILALAKVFEKQSNDNSKEFRISKAQKKNDDIIFCSKAMDQLLLVVEKFAGVDSTVLIMGESGAGKEVIARAIHQKSNRSHKTLVAVNCGAIPENLMESELFGLKKGAFTDAFSDREGLFKEADGGTLLLDEIGELPLALQVKLLRVLQEGTFRPLGATSDVKVNIRIIAATVQNLDILVKKGLFREDLYYRLNVLPLKVPPLRERKEDILLLASYFIELNNKRLGTKTKGINEEAKKMILSYYWPGNVRELRNAIERSQVLSEGPIICPSDLPSSIRNKKDDLRTIIDESDLSIKKTVRIIEEELIRRALLKTGGNRTAAAKLLEISHRALLYKIKEYRI